MGGVTVARDFAPLSADASQISVWDRPRTLPAIAFTDRAGHALTLGAFRGRPILLNIWAPWCIPCREEMPALDKLQAQIGTSALTVLPLSIDRRGLGVVEQFYRDQHLASLGVYLDQSGEAAGELDTIGVPMTLLINRDGREVGRRLGALDWDSPQVVALIDQRLGPASARRGARAMISASAVAVVVSLIVVGSRRSAWCAGPGPSATYGSLSIFPAGARSRLRARARLRPNGRASARYWVRSSPQARFRRS